MKKASVNRLKEEGKRQEDAFIKGACLPIQGWYVISGHDLVRSYTILTYQLRL